MAVEFGHSGLSTTTSYCPLARRRLGCLYSRDNVPESDFEQQCMPTCSHCQMYIKCNELLLVWLRMIFIHSLFPLDYD